MGLVTDVCIDFMSRILIPNAAERMSMEEMEVLDDLRVGDVVQTAAMGSAHERERER